MAEPGDRAIRSRSPEKLRPAGKWLEHLSPDMTLNAALQQIFRQRWETVLYYLPRAAQRAHEDVEHVHQLRVATRRLSAVLSFLAEGFPKSQREPLQRIVRKIRRCCGPARDLDVQIAFLGKLLTSARSDQAPAVRILRARAVRRRQRIQHELEDNLPGLDQELRAQGQRVLDTLQRVAGNRQQPSFQEVGLRVLSHELHELWRLAEKGKEPVIESDDPERLHELRIACKHLRYASEVFVGILHESYREEFYPQLQQMQDVLGEHHDSVEAVANLQQQRRKWKKRRRQGQVSLKHAGLISWRSLKTGLHRVIDAHEQRAEQAVDEFRQSWSKFATHGFRLPVEEMLETLVLEQGTRGEGTGPRAGGV